MASTLTEKLDKIRSPNLESQKQTAVVLGAVDSTLKEQKAEPTPTAYFASLLALLGQSLAAKKPDQSTVTSAVYLLDIVTPFTPEALLRAKFTQILGLLAPAIQQQDAEASLLRPSLGCLESLLLAQDSAAWQLSIAQIGPRRAVAALLNLSLDHRPKVRKRALEALRKVLASPPPSPSSDHPAADMCAETAMRNLQDLFEASLQAKKDKKGGKAETNDPNLIHALQLVKSIASTSGGWPSKKIEPLCELLLGIARKGNEHMTMAVFEIFEMIFAGMADGIASAKLPRLMEIITDLRPAQNDTQLLPPWIAILSRGYDVSAQTEPEETFYKLPELFAMVSEFLESPSQNITISAAECLVSFLENCIPASVLLEASVYDEKVLEKLAASAENLFTVKYQSAWRETLKVLGAMFDNMRWQSHPFLLGVTKTVGELRSAVTFAGRKEADEVIGKAIRAMGPEAVLQVLPLNLAKPVQGQAGRAWILPLLRDYTSNTNLAFFRSELVPLSEIMFQRVLEHGDAPKTMEVKIYETIVQQIWSAFPGFSDLPLDLITAFDQSFAELLANLLYSQVGLRLDICRALKILVESNQAVVAIEGEEDLVLQSRTSKEAARANLAHMGTFAGNFLAVLFNVYGQTLAHSRGPILQTINAYLSVTPAAELNETFTRVCQMLAAELQQAAPEADAGKLKQKEAKPKDALPSTSHTLMDLVITMSIHLPRESFSALFEIASVVVVKQDDPQLQKKAYKLIPRLAESETGRAALTERHNELQTLFLSTSEQVSMPARRDRLVAITALLPLIPDTSLHFIPAVLPEVVICCKEQNERARTAAFDLLVLMGHRMTDAAGALIDNSKVPHMPDDAPVVQSSLEEFFTMVSAGLAGSTPHMISASITAISRVLWEFHNSLSPEMSSDLVQTMDLFLTSNNREIVRSCLGFVKVSILVLPIALMQPRLGSLIQNLMVWSHEHKGHFRLKVKNILERLIRRFGFDIVNKHCPEDDRKLLTNIRKTKDRNKRKKAEAKEAGDEDEDKPSSKRGRFTNEYDEALASSDEEEASSDEEMQGAPRKGKSQGGNAYIVEDDDEPLDLLDRKVLASISSTKPVKMRQPTKSKAKVDADGKLILGREDNEDEAMEIDDAPLEEGAGVGAYVAAMKGKDAPKKTLKGKIKWSNKRGEESDDEMDDDDAVAVKSKVDKARQANGRGGRGGFKPRGGRGGSGRGSFSNGRRGLGEEKRKGPSMGGGRVGKPRGSPGRGGRR